MSWNTSNAMGTWQKQKSTNSMGFSTDASKRTVTTGELEWTAKIAVRDMGHDDSLSSVRAAAFSKDKNL